MTVGIVIRFGPNPPWQIGRQAIEAAVRQTHRPDVVMVIDDMAGIAEHQVFDPQLSTVLAEPEVFVWRAPWMLGVWGAFNVGHALAGTDVSLLLLAGDVLQPGALARVEGAVPQAGLLWIEGAAPDVGVTPRAPVVTRDLWMQTGGFAPWSIRPTSDLVDRMGVEREAVLPGPHFIRHRPQLAEVGLTVEQWGRREP